MTHKFELCTHVYSNYHWSDTTATTFFRLWLLFEGGVGKLADSNDGWNRYMWVIQLGLIDTGSSTHSLSVLLSAMEMSPRTQTGLEITQWASVAIISMCVRVPCILAVATIQGWCLFHSEFPIVQPLFKGSDCSRVASNQRYTVYMHPSPLTCQVSVQPVNRKTKQVLHKKFI